MNFHFTQLFFCCINDIDFVEILSLVCRKEEFPFLFLSFLKEGSGRKADAKRLQEGICIWEKYRTG